jgi:hypothetical protein
VGIEGEQELTRCLGPEELNRYAAGECTADEQAKVQAHLAECEKCRQNVRSARGGGTAQAQSTGPTGSESKGGGSSKGIPADRDESPTRSMSGVPDSLPLAEQFSMPPLTPRAMYMLCL